MYMKLTSSFLFVAAGLILCATLHAQQYHDAAAFGLKGNVKECKVVDAADGSAASDDHHFSFLGFTSDGKLDRWSDSYLDINRVSYLSEIDRSGGRLDGFLYDDCEDYRFHYSGGTLTGYSNSCLDYFIDIIEFTEVCTFHDDGKDSFSVKSFMVEYSSTELDSVIKKGFNSGKDIFPILAAYCDSHSLDKYQAYIKRYIIRERDSHGNYTLLYNTKSGKSFKRIITYWDDEPTSAKPTQAPKSPVTETTPKKTVTTSNTTGIKAVDLGLPSGVKWADRNIGASSQKDYGNYYAWGETTPKTTYTWDNYVFGKEGRLKKYNDTDNKLVLDPGDDVVSVELGSSWRMPTEEEMNELKANCTWNLTSVNGVKGFELQSKINGNSIFLPAGGYYNGNQAILKGGSGYYWTSTLDESLPDSSEHLNFDDFSGKQYVFLKDRYFGMLIRPVSAETKVAEPSQAPKAEEAPAKEAPSGFRSATPKELSFHDILNRPFGVLPTDRWRCSMDQILSELSRYGWKTITDKKISSSYTIKLDNKSGYDLSILGVIPFSVMAWFSDSGKELSSMWYSLSLKNHKETLRFCDRLISSLRSEGVNLPEPTKYATEVSAKYGKSIVRVKFPSKGSTVSFLQIDY